MKIFFSSDKFKSLCEDPKKLKKELGEIQAKLVLRRLDDLRAAESLAEHLPGRVHPLVGDRAGLFSIDLNGQYRLLFRPCNDPLVLLGDGGIDRKNVTEIMIVEIADTHE